MGDTRYQRRIVSGGLAIVRRLSLFALFIAVLATITLVAVRSNPLGHRTTRAAALIQLQPIASGLDRPISMANAADGSARLFVVEQTGAIRIYDGAQLLNEPFLDLTPFVSCCGERGLLDVAFPPDYESSGRFYVTYTAVNGNVVLARYNVTEDPNIANDDSAFNVLVIPHPGFNHNGGQIRFGPDGYLYMGVGDGGGLNGDVEDDAQNLQVLLGKILRLDVSGSGAYAVPPDNPFVADSNALDEIWAYGLRNPWRFSFDSATGDLFIADVGEHTYEELNYQPAGGPGGENYGWNRMEATTCFDPPEDCDDGNLTYPVLYYEHGGTHCSITGGYTYRGEIVDSLTGVFLYADFCSGRIWSAYESGGDWRSIELFDAPFFLPTFGQDEAGELYVTDLNNGVLYQIVSPAVDLDGDGYSDDDEAGLSENPNLYCATMRADVDHDHSVTIVDLSLVANLFQDAVPPAPERYNQDGDGGITVLDLSIMGGIFQDHISMCP